MQYNARQCLKKFQKNLRWKEGHNRERVKMCEREREWEVKG